MNGVMEIEGGGGGGGRPGDFVFSPGRHPAALTLLTLADVEFGEEIGRDKDFGPVYRAARRGTDRPLAARLCRRPPDMTAGDWGAVKERLLRILAVYAPLAGRPGLMPVVAVADEGEQVFLFSEAGAGQTLRARLSSGEGQTLAWSRTLLRQVADALEEAGRYGPAHTALQPENIVLPNDGGPARLRDIGLSCLRDRRSAYAAPEQWAGYPGDARADVFASGAILYELLAGRPAFFGRTPDELRRSIEAGTTEPLPHLTDDVRAVLAVMLSPFPGRRYGHLRYAVDDLAAQKAPASASLAAVPPDPEQAAPPVVDERTVGLLVRDGMLFPAEAVPTEAELRAARTVIPVSLPRGATETAHRDDLNGHGAGKGGEVDRLVAQYRDGRRKERDAEKAAPRLKRLRTLKGLAALFSLVALGGLRVGWMLGDYSSAVVVSVRGNPQVQVEGVTAPLVAGATLEAASLPALLTDGNSSVVLALRGARVKIGPDSRVRITGWGFGRGPVRRFAVDQGEARFDVDPLRDAGGVFDVLCGGVHARSRKARFTVKAKKEGASVTTATGSVVVENAQLATRAVEAGQSVVIVPGTPTLPAVSPALPEAVAALTADPDLGDAGGVLRVLAALEEKALLAVRDGVQSVTGLEATRALKDPAAVTEARVAMSGLHTALMSEGGGAPATLDLRTLKPLTLDAEGRDKILGCFRDRRLLRYDVLPNGYQFAARCKDSKGTVLLARNGAVSALSDEQARSLGIPPLDE